ncbi:MAG: DUF4249 domain-containing protein [Ferruginibacter sp.]|nr:DUF4249 domain-containing protein [Cytophagales bacterium]
MKKYFVFPFLFSALALAGCEDVVDVTLDEGSSQLAVDGLVTDQPGPYEVVLSKTAAYFNNVPTPRVSGATVTISDNEGNVERLTEVAPGRYVTRTLQGKIGNHYVLDIQAEGEQYRAETDIKRVPDIDSLDQVFKEESAFDDEGYYVRYYGPETPGRGDYYRFKIYRNDTLLNKPSDLLVRSDEFVEGNYIGGIEMHEDPFKVEDKIRVENCAITSDYYFFLNELYIQTNNGGMFANPPANLRTNIVNVNPASTRKAVGYFGGMGIRTKEIVIRDGK